MARWKTALGAAAALALPLLLLHCGEAKNGAARDAGGFTPDGSASDAPTSATDAEAEAMASDGPVSGDVADATASDCPPVESSYGFIGLLAQDADHLYFIVYDGFNSAATQLWKAPKNGDPGEALVTGLAMPSDLATDGNNVYWIAPGADAGPGSIMAVSVAGGSPRLVTASASTALALDATSLYFLRQPGTTGTLMRASLDGTGESLLADTGASATELELNSHYAFWENPLGIFRAPKNLGPTTNTVPAASGAYTVDDGTIYYGRSDGTLVSAPIAGGPETVLALPFDGYHFPVGTITSDSDSVYWTPGVGFAPILRVKKSGGPPVQIAQADYQGASNMVVDAHCIYWVDCGKPIDSGEVLSAPK